MAKLIMNKIEVQAKTGLTIVYSFFVIFFINVIVVWLANVLFPNDIVLGTYSLTTWWSLHHSMAKLTMITTFVIPFVYYKEWKRGSEFTPKEWMTLYFVVNAVALWVITRFSDVFGLGLSHWWVVLLLAAALDWAQGMAMMTISKKEK